MKKEEYRFFLGNSFFEIKSIEKNKYGTLIITDGGFHTLTESEGFYDSISHLMKSTFKFDKNGKEIFEGDYVKTDRGKYEVVRNHSKDEMKLVNQKETTDIKQIKSKNIEIIGNIYQK